MNDIVLNGETLEISRVVDSIEIEGFDRTFADGKMETKIIIKGTATPAILEELTADHNGIYRPTTGYNGFSIVTVNLPSVTERNW